MGEWYASLELFPKIYWSIALIGSVVLVIFLLLSLIGGDADDFDGDVDAEVEGDSGVGFQFLSIKNLSGFFAIFGWTGVACIEAGFSIILTILISIICGLLMMVSMAALFYYLSKLQSSGTLHIKNALNQVGEVYLTIGASRAFIGKVSINVQGSLRELEALTDENINLTQGNVVKVKDVTDNGILIVELLNK
ncbi:hypothetical protein M4I21_13085 [Cellulophaga sp. 20_2_10]|uniref:hypothetical protein n=1 Tax=Cellulophaga sp. 20_2_10 TaxID=2942476 RepID=UPI00201A6DD8|nr:hypothetical protein [Cellulophaga sp. 20_2_10]MCL5246753.1 hypothetical protein [Cellulophaga sp. 20_2_10]